MIPSVSARIEEGVLVITVGLIPADENQHDQLVKYLDGEAKVTKASSGDNLALELRIKKAEPKVRARKAVEPSKEPAKEPASETPVVV